MANEIIDSPKTPEEAIWDTRARVMRVEQTVIGTPGTKDEGLCGEMGRLWKTVDNNSKKIFFFAGVAVGSGVLSGISFFS